MKVVDRETFLTMPPGTVFSKVASPGALGVFKRSLGAGRTDFYSIELFPHSTWTEEDGDTFAFQVGSGRDGWNDLDERFIIWAEDEVLELIDALVEGLKLTGVGR